MITIKDLKAGATPKCKKCKKALDEETDVYHDGYKGSPHAHGGAGSTGLASHHFVFSELCVSCREDCSLCELEQQWLLFSEEARALTVWNEVGGTLCKCDRYWLCGDVETDRHPVEVVYGWEDEELSLKYYRSLCRKAKKEGYKKPAYVPYQNFENPDAKKAYDELTAAGLEVETSNFTLEKHDCSRG